jgi:8-oxo-dGTP pyrophosphatase MutT (NUDIX family)
MSELETETRRPVVSAAAVLIDRGQVLLGLMPHRGWVFPGGKIEWMERARDAVRREVKEETGLDVVVGRCLGPYDLIGTADAFGKPILAYHKVVTAWRCTLTPTSERNPLLNGELEQARWFDYSEVCYLRDKGLLSLVGADIFADMERF